MSEKYNMDFPLQLFSSKSEQKDQMVSDALSKLEVLPTYTNDAIALV